jgi:hypothetical protein
MVLRETPMGWQETHQPYRGDRGPVQASVASERFGWCAAAGSILYAMRLRRMDGSSPG